jgi:glycosyltransferase involved in cell wall biosynthesis
VRDGETGILLEKPQSDLLAEALEKLLKDTNLTETLGKNAKQFQEESLSWDAVIDSIYP